MGNSSINSNDRISDRRNNGRLRKTLYASGVLAGLGASTFAYAFLREPQQIELERLTLRMPNTRGRLPEGGLRILHLSDTHFRGADWREKPKIDRVLRKCQSEQYDLIVHTGDFLHDDGGLQNTLELLDQLPKPTFAKYAVFGNHDYTTYSAREMFSRSWDSFNRLEAEQCPNGTGNNPARQAERLLRFWRYFANAPLDLRRTGHNDTVALERELQQRGYEVLHNRHVQLTYGAKGRDGVDLFIAGVDDLTEGAPNLHRALEGIPKTEPTLLLSHNPDIVGVQGIEQADVVLAGHTHGGQIVLPWLGPLHTHTEYLSRSEASGYMRHGSTQLYITRGIGEGIPIRFAAAPQFAIITLLPD